MVYKRSLLIALALGVGLAGCDVSEDEDSPASPNPNDASAVGFKAQYQPTVGISPYPNDIYRDGATVAPPGAYDPTGPDDANADFGSPDQAVSTLDGFSTTAPINVYFNDAVDESTLRPGQTLFAVKIANQGTPITPTPVAFMADLSPAEATGQSVVELTPSAPLDPLGTYAFIVTTSVESSTGSAAQASDTFQTIKDAIANQETLDDPQLEAIKNQSVAPVMQVAQGLGLSFDDVAVGWTVTTQSIGFNLNATHQLAEQAGARPNVITAVPDGQGGVLTTSAIGGSGAADIYVGIIELPYYLDAQAPLSGFWTADDGGFLLGTDTPQATGTVEVPMLITIPNSTSNSGGAIGGTVIFQHGITGNRTNGLAVADALADAGRAMIAIDLPLHGITTTEPPLGDLFASPDSPLYGAMIDAHPAIDSVTEAHFNLDAVNNETGAAGGDGNIDSSGEHFINLGSLLTSRDNLRQGVANLFALTETIPAMSYNGDTTPDFTSGNIAFVGHSLGGIVGTSFLAFESDVGEGTLGMPGGQISDLLRDSATFGPRINQGLQAQGVIAGTQLYRDFFRNAQTVIDSGDPVHYAAQANSGHPIHMIEVVGGSTSDPDQVVPNSATEVLVDRMGLPCVDAGTAPTTGEGIVRFTVGNHASLLDPSASPAATTEMQTEMATFISSGGTTLWATAPTDSSVIQACP